MVDDIGIKNKRKTSWTLFIAIPGLKIIMKYFIQKPRV